MVYSFDPTYFDGTIFTFDDAWGMSGGWDDYEAANEPIPASCFQKALTIERAYARLPIFFTRRETELDASFPNQLNALRAGA